MTGSVTLGYGKSANDSCLQMESLGHFVKWGSDLCKSQWNPLRTTSMVKIDNPFLWRILTAVLFMIGDYGA